ncbi:MAG: FAD:protein FMN transferase [Synergistaceae bacterium]|jgi:thiamine biosynthesis lipoprotein|nr:FAD:protein FMN transferase [Synergistaceae bacterium]
MASFFRFWSALKIFFCCVAVFAVAEFVYLNRSASAPIVLERSGLGMNTLMTLSVEAPRKMGEEVLDASFSLLSTLDGALSRYKVSSDISNINAASGVSTVQVGKETVAVLSIAKEIAEKTGGYFDPTVGPLTDLWRILAKDNHWDFPSEDQVSVARALVDYRELIISRDSSLSPEDSALIRLNLAGAALDLGGIAKGYAADQVADLCKAQGIRSAMIDLGGNLMILGPRMGESPWRIGIRHPLKNRAEDRAVICTLEFELTSGEMISLSTSGSYERFREIDGKRLSHVFDPRTGFPVETSLLSVSVLDSCSAKADALSTAFLVMGEEKAREVLSSSFPSTEAVFLYLGPNEKITASLTQGLRKYLKFMDTETVFER